MSAVCKYPAQPHKVRAIDLLYYSDAERKLLDVPTCRDCYAEHILKYYPDSRIAAAIREGRYTLNNDKRYVVK